MKVAWLSPLPPVRSGIASYSMMLLPELAKRIEVTAVVDQAEVDPKPPCEVISIERFQEDRRAYGRVIAQIGNNLHHEFVWREARDQPTILVLHEVVLHHLLTEATLARGDASTFLRLMRESDGIAGEAFARGRASGHHFETGNFLFPGSSALAAASRAVIVHNRWARQRLRESGVTRPIHVLEHPLDRLASAADASQKERLRRRCGFPLESRVAGMFGFVTWPKRPDVVFESFSRALREEPTLRLLVVGEAAPNVDLDGLAQRYRLPPGSWHATGWVSDADFDAALLGVDRVVSLRYPSAGESSGPIARVFAAGRPVAVSDYAQFSDLPDVMVAKIPLGELEVERLAEFMTATVDEGKIARTQKEWIEVHGRPDEIAERYIEIITAAGDAEIGHRARPLHESTLGIMPQLSVESFHAFRDDRFVRIVSRLENRGDCVIRSAVWGEPAYRLIVKLISSGREIASEWWALPRDLPPGDSVELEGRIRGWSADEVRLVHGWFDLPLADDTPFFFGAVER